MIARVDMILQFNFSS